MLRLEERLKRLDEAHRDTGQPPGIRLLSRRRDEEEDEKEGGEEEGDLEAAAAAAAANRERRSKLMDELDEKLKRYDDLLLREHAVMSIRQPSRKLHQTYFDYVWCKKPLVRSEYQFIYRRDDFVLLGDHEDGWLGSQWTDAIAWILPKFVIKVGIEKKSPLTPLSPIFWLYFPDHLCDYVYSTY